jgi:hypothetical protein
MELDNYIHIKTHTDLSAYIEDKFVGGKNNYFFIDEVQEVQEFERTLRSLLAKGICDIYCTGSNAKMLSGDLATFLSGRYLVIINYASNLGITWDLAAYTEKQQLQFLLFLKGCPITGKTISVEPRA